MRNGSESGVWLAFPYYSVIYYLIGTRIKCTEKKQQKYSETFFHYDKAL